MFAQKQDYYLFGEPVSEIEFQQYVSEDEFSTEQTRSNTQRNNDEFDIHLNFDEQNPGCSWSGSILPGSIYAEEHGITFGNDDSGLDGPKLINECGNFGVSGHSSPVFIGNNGGSTPGDLTMRFESAVSKVQINAGGQDVTFTMSAYDVSGNLLTSSTLEGATALAPISVSAAGIRKVIVTTSGSSDVFVFDDLKVRTGLSGTYTGQYYSSPGTAGSPAFGELVYTRQDSLIDFYFDSMKNKTSNAYAIEV